jgi:hypothetical protein
MAYQNQYARHLLPVSTSTFDRLKRQGGNMPPIKPIATTIKPGQKVPDSGIYRSTISKVKSTMVKNEPAPPTPRSGEKWKQIVNTNK